MTSRRTGQKTRRYHRTVNRTQTRRRKNTISNKNKSRQHGGG
jgi:hypothetical protein